MRFVNFTPARRQVWASLGCPRTATGGRDTNTRDEPLARCGLGEGRGNQPLIQSLDGPSRPRFRPFSPSPPSPDHLPTRETHREFVAHSRYFSLSFSLTGNTSPFNTLAPAHCCLTFSRTPQTPRSSTYRYLETHHTTYTHKQDAFQDLHHGGPRGLAGLGPDLH